MDMASIARRGGFPGCEVFDCFGAGQQVVQVTFGGAVVAGRDDVAARCSRRSTRCGRCTRCGGTSPTPRPATLPEDLRREVAQRRSGRRPALGGGSRPARRARRRRAAPRGRRPPRPGERGGARRTGRAGPPRSGPGRSRPAREALRGADLRGALLIGADLRAPTSAWRTCSARTSRGADLEARPRRRPVPHRPAADRGPRRRGDAHTGAVPRPARWPDWPRGRRQPAVSRSRRYSLAATPPA